MRRPLLHTLVISMTLLGLVAATRLPRPTRSPASPKATFAKATAAKATLALVGGTLIDGHGGAPIPNSVILVEGERIVAIGQTGTLSVPAGTPVVSTEGEYILPGLWDMHVHLMLVGHGNYAHWDSVSPPLWERVIIPAAARQSLMAGVTSVRDLGGPLDELLAVKRRIAAGELPGATIYTTGPFLQHAPYPGTERFRRGITGVADARAKVKQ